MILNEVNFFSEVLGVRSTMYVLLAQRSLAEKKNKRTPKYRTLYLLYGHSDDHTGATELGVPAHPLTAWLQAEAQHAACVPADIANTVARDGFPFVPPCALLTTGELLVTVGKERGMGGRNQEFALAAALRIAGSRNIVVGAIDSDGTDGPGGTLLTDGQAIRCLAGGLVDGWTADETHAAGVDIREALRTHNTSPALWRLDSGIHATPNVSMTDLGVILILGRE